MKVLRQGIFETNSSSTHSLVMKNSNIESDYLPFGDTLKIEFFNEERPLTTLKEKVSYLVSHIVSWYKYDAEDYEELIRQVRENYDFKRIASYVEEKFHKKIVFPKEYKGDLDDIVTINHQLISWDRDIEEVLQDIVNNDRDYLAEVLNPDAIIEFGRD